MDCTGTLAALNDRPGRLAAWDTPPAGHWPDGDVVELVDADAEDWVWMAARNALGPKIVTGSAVAAIVGESRYRGPADEWERRFGTPRPWPTSEAMRWGQRLEEPVLRAYAEDYGLDVRRTPRLIGNRRFPLIVGSPDVAVVDGDGLVTAIVDAKVTNPFSTSTTRLREYTPQLWLYGTLTGVGRGVPVALVGGQHLEVDEIEVAL